jgi:hypothetical protein
MTAFPKLTQRRNRPYLRWIRRQGCLVCRRYAQAHHVHHAGLKGSDFETVPLCGRHHMELHQVGQSAFERKYVLDLEQEAQRMFEKHSAEADGGIAC